MCGIKDHTSIRVIPPTPEALANVTPPIPCANRPIPNQLAMRKIQGVLVKEALKALRVRATINHSHEAGYCDGRTAHDVNHTQLAMHRSQLSRILEAPLYAYENRLTPYGFVFQMRYFLNRPMLIPDGRAKGADAGLTGEDSEFPLCESGHCTPIGQDPTGNHAVACRA